MHIVIEVLPLLKNVLKVLPSSVPVELQRGKICQ